MDQQICTSCDSCKQNFQFYIPETIDQYDEVIAEINALPNKTASVVINTTDNCPLRCRYCFVNFKPKNMPFDTIDLFLTKLLDGQYNFAKGTRFNINFFGGEPLMQFKEIIKPIVEKYNNTFNWGITTNGVLLTQEIIDFMFEHHFSVLLSIDGAPPTQDYNRPYLDGRPTSTVIEKWIPQIIEKFPNTCFRSTLIPATCMNIGENIGYAVKHGFKSFFVIPNEYEDWSTEENQQKLVEVVQTIGSYYLTNFINGTEPIRFSSLDNMLVHLLKNSGKPNVLASGSSPLRCGLGLNSFGLGVDGQIIGCQEKASQSDNVFMIGDVWKGIDKARHLDLLIKYKTEHKEIEGLEKCNQCICRSMCGQSSCLSRQLDIGEKFNTSLEKGACKFRQELYKVALGIDEACALLETAKPIYQQFLVKSLRFSGGES